MIEKFTFNLHAPRVKQKMILVKSEMELRSHVILKLLAFALYYDPRLKIEVSVGMPYKPDLVIPGNSGVPELWIDCGTIALRKVKGLTQKLRRTRIVIVKETERELRQFQKLIAQKIEHVDRLEFLAFESHFVAGLAENLRHVNHLTLYPVTEDSIGVALNDQIFESTLYGTAPLPL